MIIDHSARAVWDTCKRKYLYTYVYKLDPGRSDAMERGRAAHEGLYAGYKTGQVDEAVQATMIERPLGLFPGEEQKYRELEWATKELVRGYFNRVKQQGWDDELEFIAGELYLMWEYTDEKGRVHHYVGILDAVVKHKVIGELIHEYKTTGQLMTDWVARFQLDNQTTGYFFLRRKNGGNPRGAILSVLRTSKYPDYVRDMVEHREWQLEEFEAELKEVIKDISDRLERVAAGEEAYTLFYKNTDACFKYNVACPFRSMCLEKPETRHQMVVEGYIRQRGEREADILKRAQEGK